MTQNLKCIALAIIGILLYMPLVMATGSTGDVILLDGKQWEVLAKPIETDSVLSQKLRHFLPKERSWSTANWEGYTAYWIIKDDALYLQKVQIELYDKENVNSHTIEYDTEALKEVFAPYYTSEGICAKWFSRKIRLGRGKLIRYEHAGFDRNTEEECVLLLQEGKVVRKQCYHNYKKEGLKLEKLIPEIIKRFPFGDFSELRQQKRVVVIMSDIQLTPDNHFSDCDISIRVGSEYIKDQEYPIIKVMKETLASIYPWEVLYINGEYRSNHRTFAFPLNVPD